MIAHYKLTNSLYQILIENLIQVLYCVSAVQLSIVPKRPTRIPKMSTPQVDTTIGFIFQSDSRFGQKIRFFKRF